MSPSPCHAASRPVWESSIGRPGAGGVGRFDVAAVALLYYGAAKLGYQLEFAGPVAAIVWLPVGMAIAYLSIRGLSAWPGVLIGDLLANNYGALPVFGALGQTCGNMLEVLVAAALVRRAGRPGESALETMSGVARLVFALVLGTALSATIGPLSLVSQGVVEAHSLLTIARTWWLGDFSGAIVVVPLALAWYRPPKQLLTRGRTVEAVLTIVVVAALTEIATRTNEPLVYLAFPALGWAAVRFGPRGATLAVTVSVGVTLWSVTHYHGPFVFHSITRTVLSTQLFIVVAAVSSLCLAALVSEREAFAERLGRSRQDVFAAAERERHRIERNLHDGAQQRLLALTVRLRLAAERARAERDPSQADLVRAERELYLALDELRELSHGTHPSVLTELGLADAIRSVAARSTVPVRTVLPSTRAADASEAVAYYVVAEAIVNVQKHARASEIVVRVGAEGAALSVEVSDDGIGGAGERAGGGLEGLRERVESCGGALRVRSPLGGGTRISAEIPA